MRDDSDEELWRKQSEFEKLVDQLDQAGYFSFQKQVTGTARRRAMQRGHYKFWQRKKNISARERVLENHYLYEKSTGRSYNVDAENIAEGGVVSLVERLKPFLETQGMTLRSIEQDFTDHGYSVSVNGTTYVMYSQQELRVANIWELATKRAFGMINRLLSDAGSDERIYNLFGPSEDGWAVFLDDTMFQLILQCSVLEDEEKPERID